jgi:hypothetical protein
VAAVGQLQAELPPAQRSGLTPLPVHSVQGEQGRALPRARPALRLVLAGAEEPGSIPGAAPSVLAGGTVRGRPPPGRPASLSAGL